MQSLKRDREVEKRERIEIILNTDLLKLSLRTIREPRDCLVPALFSVGFDVTKGHPRNVLKALGEVRPKFGSESEMQVTAEAGSDS